MRFDNHVPVFEISDFDREAAEAARARQDQLTKPRGSLAALERVPAWLAGWQRSERPTARPASVILFASDHPVTKHGVSAYPAAVTPAMVHNIVQGGAASSVLARLHGLPLRVVDVGVDGLEGPLGDDYERSAAARIAAGDLRVGEAMTAEGFEAAVRAGADAVDALPPTRLLLLGEMGIGNTTPAAAVCVALLGADPELIVGAGTGVTGDALTTKQQVVREAAALVADAGPAEVMRRVGGRELAAMMGAMGRAAERGIPTLVDGFVVTAAALTLVRLAPAAREALWFAHVSDERGHRAVLEALNADPLLDLGLRLGEGSGALTAFPLVEAACALHGQMATFDSAAVPDKD